MQARRLTVRALAVLCVTVFILILTGVTVAMAAYQHPYVSQLTSTPSGPFSESVCGVTVDQMSQDVYVADAGNDAIDIFNGAGEYQSQITGIAVPFGSFTTLACSIAVSETTGDVYIADSGPDLVYVFNALGGYLQTIDGSGAPGGSLGNNRVHVAVDQASGDIYIADSTDSVVDRYNAAGEYLSQITGIPQASGLAVGPTGELSVIAEENSSSIYQFDSSANQIRHITPGGSLRDELTSVALDTVGDLYVANRTSETVEEYDSSGSPAGETSGVETPGGSFNDPEGIALSAGDDLYVSDLRAPGVLDAFGSAVLVPDAVMTAPSEVTETSMTLNGAVNPEGMPVSACRFEYGTTSSYGQSVPCEQAASAIGAGSAPVAVSARIAGLQPSAVRHFRLVAVNSNGTKCGSDLTLEKPNIESESTLTAGSNEAKVSAQISTGGVTEADGVQALATSYHVEYGTSEQYGSSTQEANIGAPRNPILVSAQLSNLQAGTEYHFRFVATSSAGSTLGPDVAFTTQRSAATLSSTLPDNRAYELVSSPSDNQNVYDPVTGERFEEDASVTLPFRASADGNSVTYVGAPSPGDGNGAFGKGQGNQFLGIRDRRGWTTRDITPPRTDAETNYRYFSSDLSIAILASAAPIASASPAGPAGCSDLYSGTGGENGYHALYVAGEISEPCDATFSAGASADNSHLIFESGGTLNAESQAGTPSGAGDLYDFVDGRLYLVNVLPDGQPEGSPTASYGSPRLEVEAFPNLSNVISANGSRIFWTSDEIVSNSEPLNPSFSPKALYVRENDTRPQSPIGPKGECEVSGDACTVQVDAGDHQCFSEGKCGSGGGRFWTASSDGSNVLFTDCAKLTFDSTAVSSAGCIEDEETPGVAPHPVGNDLYEYDVNSGRLTDLTVDGNTGDPRGADVQGVVGASEDDSYVYFVASGALAPGATARSCTQPTVQGSEEVERQEEEQGLLPAHHGCNLYVRHDGVTTFVGALLVEDDNLAQLFGTGAAPRGDWRAALGERTAEVTPDGHGLVFISTGRLTGYDSAGYREVFVYDAPSKKLLCASCDPTGAPPVFSQKAGPEALGAYLPTTYAQDTFMKRLISSDGDRVFFETEQALAPQDANGRQDVYEWERDGAGSCPTATATEPEHGCIYLLSGGYSDDNSYLVDADAGGENVFFTSRGRLEPLARNENVAMYDARVNGGFPGLSLACTGSGCQGVPPAPPIFATPSSVTFDGVGNFEPAPRGAVKPKAKPKACKRGFTRKRGRCVKKTAKKTKRSSTHSKRGRKR
jgi:hypothetical protein